MSNHSALENMHVAVVGASLGGLSVANVLHRLGAQVEVFEAFPHGFQDRGGALGGVDVGLLQDIRGDGAKYTSNGGGHYYGDLWRYLFDGLPQGMVHFGSDVIGVEDPNTRKPKLVVENHNGQEAPATRFTFDLVVGADGGKSTIRQYVTEDRPTYAGYTLWRGLVPTKAAPGMWSGYGYGLAGSAKHEGNYYETGGYSVQIKGEQHWNAGVYMGMPEAEVAAPTRNRQIKHAMKSVPDWFVPFTTQMFGKRCGAFWASCSEKGKVSPHPVWELAVTKAVHGRILLLGDAAHMATPRTGCGFATAMADSVALGRALQQCMFTEIPKATPLEAALEVYNDSTVSRAQVLWQVCRRIAAKHAPEGAKSISPATLVQ